jgi:hypothetical protein
MLVGKKVTRNDILNYPKRSLELANLILEFGF